MIENAKKGTAFTLAGDRQNEFWTVDAVSDDNIIATSNYGGHISDSLYNINRAGARECTAVGTPKTVILDRTRWAWAKVEGHGDLEETTDLVESQIDVKQLDSGTKEKMVLLLLSSPEITEVSVTVKLDGGYKPRFVVKKLPED